MVIAERALKTLEYYKIREEVGKYCTSSIGKTHIEKLVPSVDYEEVTKLLEEMDEGLTILRLRGNVPMGGIVDIRPHAKRAQIGGMLSPMELMETASTIRASKILRNFLENVADAESVAIPHFLSKRTLCRF